MKNFIDLTEAGAVSVTEYEDRAEHLAVLFSFGEGHSFKVSPEQAKDIHSALLRLYELAPQ